MAQGNRSDPRRSGACTEGRGKEEAGVGARAKWQAFGATAGLLLGVAPGALLGGFYGIFVLLGLCIGVTVAYAFVGDRETTPEKDAATAAAATEQCLSCADPEACRASCPEGVDIPRYLTHVYETYMPVVQSWSQG